VWGLAFFGWPAEQVDFWRARTPGSIASPRHHLAYARYFHTQLNISPDSQACVPRDEEQSAQRSLKLALRSFWRGR